MCGPAPCDKPDCTWGEAFRAKTEIKYVQKLTSDECDDYLKEVSRHRGPEAAAQLRSAAGVDKKPVKAASDFFGRRQAAPTRPPSLF